jgi:hypothetical protein
MSCPTKNVSNHLMALRLLVGVFWEDLEGEMFEEMGGAGGCVCFCSRTGIDPDSNGGSLQKGRVFGCYGETVRQRRRLSRSDERVCGGCKGTCDEGRGAGTEDRGDGFAGEGGWDEQSRGRHCAGGDEKTSSGRASWWGDNWMVQGDFP